MKTITRFFLVIAASLLAAFSYGQELVTNGNFEAGDAGWSGNAKNVVTEGGNKYNAANVAAAGNPWDANLSQVLSLTQGQTYKLKFDAWSDRSRTIIAGIGLNQDPWSSSVQTITLSNVSQAFTLTLVAPATSTNSRVIFDMGAAIGFVGIDNVSLMAVDPTCNDGVQNGTETGVDCGGSCSACVIAGPTTAALTPPARPTSDVVSVFSNAYTNIAVNEWGPNWGGTSSRINEVQIQTNPTKVMAVNAGQVFAGIDFAPSKFNATAFTHFHMDYWIASPIPAGQVIVIKLSNHIASGESNAILTTHVVTTGGSWIPLDIPLSSFTHAGGAPELDRTAIAQIVIDAARADLGVPLNIFMDNIYFHKGITAGLNVVSKENEIRCYPNPALNTMTISAESNINAITVRNLVGQSIQTEIVNGTSKVINLSNLPSGNYFVVAKMKSGETSIQKFSKL